MKNPNENVTTTKRSRDHGARKVAAALSVMVLLGASAAAQVTPTGPFSGLYQEDWEGSMSLALSFAPNPVFQGNAEYHTSYAIQATNWSYGCTINPYAGSKFIGDIGGSMWFEFGATPTRFGGYFGTNQPNGPAVVTVRFLDSSSNLISTDIMTIQNTCGWQWSGWNFGSANVRRVEFEYTSWIEHVMMDDLELDFQVVNSCFETFCFGDGSAGVPCPCGNAGAAGEGCANASGSGATLALSGSCSVSVNDAGLVAGNLPQNKWALFFEGGSVIGAGAVPFRDGVLCVGAPYRGLQFLLASTTGVAQTTVSLVSPPGVPVVYHSPGETTYYQCYYNTPGGSSVCGTYWNLTNGVELTWTP